MDLQPSAAEVDAAIRHLVSLMAADSTSGREGPAVIAAQMIAIELGLATSLQAAAPERNNLIATPPGITAPRIVLCTHLDTVPPFIAPTVSTDTIHGRGACDAKGVAIAMLCALARAGVLLGRPPEAACVLVVGEETDHVGARAFAAAPPFSPEHIVLGEPCGVHPAAGQKGLLKLRLEASGRAAHSGYPELGTSAIHKLIRALDRLLATPLPCSDGLGDTTVNIGLVGGGLAANVLAPTAFATALVRCAAPTDTILAIINDALGPDITTHIENRVEPRTFDHLAAPIEALGRGPAVPFNTDANDLAPLGAAMHLLGPGDMRCAHGPDEHLTFRDLADGIAAFTRILVAHG